MEALFSAYKRRDMLLRCLASGLRGDARFTASKQCVNCANRWLLQESTVALLLTGWQLAG